jgi:hypothetical protein
VLLIFISQTNSAISQAVNFDSYNKITDSRFKEFVNLFTKRNLPISTDALFNGVNLRNLKTPEISNESINKYLAVNGELINGPLYIDKPDDDAPEVPVNGKFYPLYKLPTNGDYVLLVFAQIDPWFDGHDMVFALTFDLQGKYINYANSLYTANSEYMNNYIDYDLSSHYTYVLYAVNNEFTFPPIDRVFSGMEAHSVLQIGNDGKLTKTSFTKVNGQFQFSMDEYRFKRAN